ncbi:hypothetical protein Nepgr_032434 [Nepenthes gracilis]|uniref:RRM domain-containing protein n=1 Tax=Nepenthes gracilis TaxID=150966 RepID=A0AAD3TKA0_NEPGR|nr:hypothetical protein Nepgr_032434 [Nepenthes gracilis]
MMNRTTIFIGNIPQATVKVEPNIATSMASGPPLPQMPSVPRPVSQGLPSLLTSSPPPVSQEMIPTLTGGTSLALQSMSGNPTGIHMSNMRSSGMASSMAPSQTIFSSGQSAITTVSGSRKMTGTTQPMQSSTVNSFTSASTNVSGKFQPLFQFSCYAMRRYSPSYYSPPGRGYGGRVRSPPRGGYSPPRRGYSPPRRGYSSLRRDYGGIGRSKEQNIGSLLVRNIPLDCRPEELRVPFERFGVVRDVYIPKDYYTGEPRGFAFVQFVDAYDAREALYHMNGQLFSGREISVVAAAESRKRPEEMRRKARGPSRYGGRRSPRHGRSHSHSRSPHHHSGSGGRYRSGSYTPSPRRHDYTTSPDRRHANHPRSPIDSPLPRDEHRSPYSPAYDGADQRDTANGYDKKFKYDAKEARDRGGTSPRQLSRSPSRSRS